LSTLEINLSGGENEISDEGLQSFCNSVQHLEHLSTLSLDLSGGKHRVTTEGKKNIEEFLKGKVVCRSVKITDRDKMFAI